MLHDNDVDAALLSWWPLPVPKSGDKNTRGSIFVVAGSTSMPGAAVLTATAALRAGAGKLSVGTSAAVAHLVAAAVVESLVVPLRETASGALALSEVRAIVERANRTDALVIGPGMTGKLGTSALLAAALPALRVPVVVDAIALGALRTRATLPAHLEGRAVLTPHAGEMASLLGCDRDAVESDPAAHARDVARRLRAVVVLKGGTTYIAAPDGALYRHLHGVIGLATSGSGDVLAGIIGGLLARGISPLAAAAWGVYLHAQAGLALSRSIGMGFLAHELLPHIPVAMRAHGEPV
ncbi:MAG: NAD(P)H-hydrate dehydratase [Candidatus Eremiobacteraeota bacterium]|nr:NAD(P)H-hydrate dehydratase [Candidatus Eremiobacteraeota bacterium]